MRARSPDKNACGKVENFFSSIPFPNKIQLQSKQKMPFSKKPKTIEIQSQTPLPQKNVLKAFLSHVYFQKYHFTTASIKTPLWSRQACLRPNLTVVFNRKKIKAYPTASIFRPSKRRNTKKQEGKYYISYILNIYDLKYIIKITPTKTRFHKNARL